MKVTITNNGRRKQEAIRETSRITILVVDDSPIDRRIAGSILSREGTLSVVYATDGREALEVIERERPSVVVTDMQMPELDGLGLVEEVGRNHPGLPVILMTAYGSEDVAIRALRLGAASYVPKKAIAGELVETIRQVLRVSAVDRQKRRLLGCVQHRESTLELASDPALIPPLVEILLDDMSSMDLCDANKRTRVGVALQESLANAIYHGNLEVSSDLRQEDERRFYQVANQRREIDPYRGRRVQVQARMNRDEARFIIRDDGPGFDTTTLDRPIEPEDLMRVGGRGMLLIRTFMDEVSHNSSGNQITLFKRREPVEKTTP